MGSTVGTAGQFEVRSFVEVPPFQNLQTTQCDIYVFKKGFVDIGVKIRNPHTTKKGNYEFDGIEVKIMTQRVGLIQKWDKTYIPLEKQFKLRQQTIEQLNKVIRRSLKQLSTQSQTIMLWAQRGIDALIRIDKDKKKWLGKETGTLKMCKLFSEQYSPHYFQTLNHQSQSLSSFQKDTIKSNTSYPALIEALYG